MEEERRRSSFPREPRHYQRWAVLIAALLTTAVLMVVVRIPGRDQEPPKTVTVAEQNGVYDLTGFEALDGMAVTLPPGEFFYPNTYLTPENAAAAIPERVGRYEELRAGYLTQRFLIEVPDNHDVYALTVGVAGRHAMKVYVNGRPAGQAGEPGTTKQATEIWENNLTVYAAPQDGKIEILLHSAQFYHYKRGASLATLSLRPAGPEWAAGLSTQSRGYLVMGGLLFAGGFLLCLFLLRLGTRATLYFALACLVMAMRECLQSQAWTDLPFLGGNLSFMLEYLSMVLLTVFLTLYLAQNLPGGFWRAYKLVVLVVSAAYAACLLLGDSVFYTSVLIYYQVFLVSAIAGGVAGLFWTMRRPTAEQAAALYGIAVFYLAAVGDILMYNDTFPSWMGKAPVSETAMLVFVLVQTLSLFLMNNRLIAEAREGERKLAGEKEVLERLSSMKTEFLGNISHELKTPLTVVSSNIQYVRSNLPDQPGLEDTARAMRLIDGEASRMAMMVSQLLDVSRIDEGRMGMESKRESLVEIIQSTLDNYYPFFSKNHNTLTFRREGNIPPVWCDRNRIAQVLVNLIANAVRHTRQGEIAVSVSREEDKAVITLRDTGEGIAPERLPHLFERYYTRRPAGQQADAGGDTGTGLGLYICKYIVEAHGGGIAIESEPGRGTRVKVALPVEERAG